MSDNAPQLGGKGQGDEPGLPRLWAEKRKNERPPVGDPRRRVVFTIDASAGGVLGSIDITPEMRRLMTEDTED